MLPLQLASINGVISSFAGAPIPAPFPIIRRLDAFLNQYLQSKATVKDGLPQDINPSSQKLAYKSRSLYNSYYSGLWVGWKEYSGTMDVRAVSINGNLDHPRKDIVAFP